MGGAGLTANLMHVVDQFFGAGAQIAGDLAMIAFEKTGENQFVDIIHRHPQLVKKPVDGPGNYLAVPFVPRPAFLPDIVILFIHSAVMVHKIDGQRIGSFVFGNHIRVSNHQGCGPIAKPHFIKIGGFCFTTVGRRYEYVVSFTAHNSFNCRNQRGRSDLLRGGIIRCNQVLFQVERR